MSSVPEDIIEYFKENTIEWKSCTLPTIFSLKQIFFLSFKNILVNSLIEKCSGLTALETKVQALFLDV